MMTHCPDILFMTEYIKNVLYFATVRHGKVLNSTPEVHYFCIDNELVYENYYSDFGPLNLGCVYKYCKILNEKIKQYLNKQTIIHYTSTDPKKKTNSAFLLGCYGVLYLSLTPKDALKPLLLYGQTYRAFQDATQGDSIFTISLMDCLQAIKKAWDLGLFNFSDFNYEEYERLDKIQGGDLNWIVPGKFLAFIGPVDYSVSLYHPPEMYIEYFRENNVKIVIRLNKRMYDGNVFSNAGIVHYDLFFPDGFCPPRHILSKFLQISEEADGAIAVHCKAGLGRTGSLIGCYLIKHYRMTSHEAIGWMRICRPGSVIGHQQGWLEKLEAWLLKQGNLYRKRTYQDTEKLPLHEYGIYSIAEKAIKQRPVVFSKSPSPPPPIQRQTRSEITPLIRPQASRVREEGSETSDDENRTGHKEEKFITSCDLTVTPKIPATRFKGCIIKSNTTLGESSFHDDLHVIRKKIPLWKRILCCNSCTKTCDDLLWMLAVRCAKVTPKRCHTTKCCSSLDMAVPGKAAEKEHSDWRVRTPKLNNNQKISPKGESTNNKAPGSGTISRRASGAAAGEPRLTPRSPSRNSVTRPTGQRTRDKPNRVGDDRGGARRRQLLPAQEMYIPGAPGAGQPQQYPGRNRGQDFSARNLSAFPPVPTFRTTQGPIIKTLNDARNFLLRSSLYNEQKDKKLNSSITVTPHYSFQVPNYMIEHVIPGPTHLSPFSSVARGTTQPQQRRRLGRSPSPSPSPSPTRYMDQTRATNTPSPVDRFLAKDASKSGLREALSRLKLNGPRVGSVGAASVGAGSLGARRDAPPAKPAPSVRSDERPLATQGDMLNSIKFQRRFRDTLNAGKLSALYNEKISISAKDRANTRDSVSKPSSTGARPGFHQDYMSTPKDRPNMRDANLRTGGTACRLGFNQDYSNPRDKNVTNAPKVLFNSTVRPTSPKGRQRTSNFY